jgi:hypothetical protein
VLRTLLAVVAAVVCAPLFAQVDGLATSIIIPVWFDVGFREGGNATFPIPFGIKCIAGNGVMWPRWVQTLPDEF